MREEQASGLATSLDADFTRSLDFIKAGELCFTNGPLLPILAKVPFVENGYHEYLPAGYAEDLR